MATGTTEVVFYGCHPPTWHGTQSSRGYFRNIHTTKPFSCLKPLILPIAPGESAKTAPRPARQGASCWLPTYLTSPLPSLSPLCWATVTPFIFPKRAKTAAATQASYLFSHSLEFSTSSLPGWLLPSLQGSVQLCPSRESVSDHSAPVTFHHITCSFSFLFLFIKTWPFQLCLSSACFATKMWASMKAKANLVTCVSRPPQIVLST